MATPVADSYSAPSGATLRAGRFGSRVSGGLALDDIVAAGALGSNLSRLAGGIALDDVLPAGTLTGLVTPAWRAGKTNFAWATIPGTAANTQVRDYCGVAWREDDGGCEAASLAPGGHGGNYTLSEVGSIQLMDDVPAWVHRYGPGDSTGWSTVGNGSPFFPADGSPAPTHYYNYVLWAGGAVQRYLRFGQLGTGSSAAMWRDIRAFDPITNTWDAPGTWADFTNTNGGWWASTVDPSTGIMYGAWNGVGSYDPRTGAMTRAYAAPSGGGLQPTRYGTFDEANGDIFFINANDNWAGGLSPVAGAISLGGVTGAAYTFNASAAYSDLNSACLNAGWAYANLVYDKDTDGFWYYGGLSGATAKVYYLKRNVGSRTIDVSIPTVTGVTPPTCDGGVHSKFHYSSRLRCLILIVSSAGANVHFLPTATL